ncbi:SPOSA6832_02368 [Sporobolomyces salmonicolor]|uniref:SPOSA6832_02368-mRNA-1:cds n=1 Tax=Sporidiobolus salmonicolor TaxID=5005 RepID=A0A0D6EM89_SPOSA|nr:SPOSA6832_02368 [Sporobolomyces salmonicolor]
MKKVNLRELEHLGGLVQLAAFNHSSLVADQAHMPPAKALSNDPITKRIHIGGLAPSVTAKDLVHRFSSFGSIVGGENGVDGLGTSESGLPRSFAFFSLETSEAKFSRCTPVSLLRDIHKLIKKLRRHVHAQRFDVEGPQAQDRPRSSELAGQLIVILYRLIAEREAADKEAEKPASRPKKRKRNPDPNVGFAASHFELITKDNIEQHKGWVLDPKPAPSPLFPLIVRPSHPIELPAKPAATAWTRGTTKAKPSKAAREALRAGVPLERPPLKRIKRMRIDPRRWGRKKVVFGQVGDEGGSMLGVGTWECEEVEEQKADEPEVTWVFKARDGSVRRRETVRLTQRSVPHTDRFTALLEGLNRPSSASTTRFVPVPAPTAEQPILVDSTSGPAPAARSRSRSASPPPYVPAAPRTLLYNEEDAFQLMASALGDDERAIAHAMERAEYRKLAQSVVVDAEEEVVERSEAPVLGQKLPKVEGFADDDEDVNDLFPAMRLRGGGGASSSDSSDDSDSDSSSDDDSSSDEEDKDAKVEEVAAPAAAAPKTTLAKDSLKAMFKPQEETESAQRAGGFSLLSGLEQDLDLEPLQRTPSPPPAPAPAPVPRFAPPPSYRQAPRQHQQQPTGPAQPFFAFPSGAFEERQTGNVKAEEVAKLREAGAARGEQARIASGHRLAEKAAGFWRRTDSSRRGVYRREEIEEQHQKLRENLRGFSRKRHREAAKRSKKKSGPGGRRGAGGLALDIPEDV